MGGYSVSYLPIGCMADFLDRDRHLFEDLPLKADNNAADGDFALGAVCGFDYVAQEAAAAGHLHDHHADGFDCSFIY